LVQSAFRTTEKNRSGAPEAQISPQQPKFEPLPKRFFSPSYSKDLIYQVPLRINRMNHIFFRSQVSTKKPLAWTMQKSNYFFAEFGSLRAFS
jgi:hypothetical protein